MLEEIQGVDGRSSMREKKTFDDVVSLSRRLRAPDGCPWDREQTMESLRPYVLEEAYEVIQAIESGDAANLVEELGDFLFQVVFISQIAREEGKFRVDDVLAELCDKLVRRHPHVFGEKKAKSAREAVDSWNSQKRKEKKGKPALEEVPRALPSLMRAQRVGEKAARRGFDWTGAAEVLRKVREELSELSREIESGNLDRARGEWGDLVFSMASLARHLGIDAETASHEAVGKFSERFSLLEKAAEAQGGDMDGMSAERLDRLWEEAKKSRP